jgi:hypothetical protein
LTGSWRTLHDAELHNLFSSPNIIRMIMSTMMMGWAEHVADMKEMRNSCNTKFWLGNLKNTTTWKALA